MALIQLTGISSNTIADLPKPGEPAPNFTLTKNDFSSVSLAGFKGKKVVLNIFLSVDTETCANSVHAFNTAARFCGAEGITNLEMLTDYKDGNVGKAYGVAFKEGPLQTLFSRAVVILDEESNVIYTEHVPIIANEPNYKAALEALKHA